MCAYVFSVDVGVTLHPRDMLVGSIVDKCHLCAGERNCGFNDCVCEVCHRVVTSPSSQVRRRCICEENLGTLYADSPFKDVTLPSDDENE